MEDEEAERGDPRGDGLRASGSDLPRAGRPIALLRGEGNLKCTLSGCEVRRGLKVTVMENTQSL